MKFRRTEHPVMIDGPVNSVLSRLYCNVEGGAPDAGGGTPPPGDAPPAIVAPWAAAGEGKAWMIGEAGKERPWYEAIPEGPVREHAKSKGWANPAEAAMSNYNLTRLHTGNGNVVEIPGEDATPEARAKFYEKLGRPVDATKYDFSKAWAKDLEGNKDFKPNENFVKFGQGLAFELGLSTTQAETMAGKYREYEREQHTAAMNAAKAENESAVEALKGTYGKEYDAYLAAGKSVTGKLNLPDATLEALEKNMGSAPVLDLLCRIGRAGGEAGKMPGTGGSGPADENGMSADQAAAEIKRMRSDATVAAALNDKTHAQHQDMVAKLNRLYAKAGDKADA